MPDREAPAPLTVDVVIPVYRRFDLTERCLRHLAVQSAPHTTIVVDNGSGDGTAGRIRSSSPSSRVIELTERVGFATACNRGAAAGEGAVIVLLNNDVEVAPDFVERLTRPFGDAPRLGSAAALLVRPEARLIDSLGLTADRTLAGFPRLAGSPVDEAGTSTGPVLTGPCGGAGAYRRTAWESVGGLDEGVRFYGEDLDLALRLRSAGWETVAAADAVAVHLGSATFGTQTSWQRYESGFSRGFFLRRYRPISTAAALRAALTETLVVVGDAVLSRDLCAGRGRLAGWRAARGATNRPTPPQTAIDMSIGFAESLGLRRAARGG